MTFRNQTGCFLDIIQGTPFDAQWEAKRQPTKMGLSFHFVVRVPKPHLRESPMADTPVARSQKVGDVARGHREAESQPKQGHSEPSVLLDNRRRMDLFAVRRSVRRHLSKVGAEPPFSPDLNVLDDPVSILFCLKMPNFRIGRCHTLANRWGSMSNSGSF